MFVEIPADKIRKGLLGIRKLFDTYQKTVSFELKCVGFMEDDEMMGVVIYGGGRIFSIGVPEQHRCCGYGRKLLEYVINDTGSPTVVCYVPTRYFRATAALIGCGFYFEGFFTTEDVPTRHYRLVYNKVDDTPPIDYYNDKLWEDTATLAEEALVAYNVGTVL